MKLYLHTYSYISWIQKRSKMKERCGISRNIQNIQNIYGAKYKHFTCSIMDDLYTYRIHLQSERIPHIHQIGCCVMARSRYGRFKAMTIPSDCCQQGWWNFPYNFSSTLMSWIAYSFSFKWKRNLENIHKNKPNDLGSMSRMTCENKNYA